MFPGTEDHHIYMILMHILKLINNTRWVFFDDPAWESYGWVGWGG